jgi:transposase
LGTSRYVYNQALNGIKNNSETINFYKLRNKYTIAKNNEFVTEWQQETPKDVRAEAVHDVCKAYKTCFSQLKTGLITNFNVGYRTKKKEASIVIPKSALKVDGKKIIIYKKYTKKPIKLSRDFRKNKISIESDCRLQHTHTGWFLIIPFKIPIDKSPKLLYEKCALDPGSRKFQTLYSPHESIKFKHNHEYLKSLRTKQKKLQYLRATKQIKSKTLKKSLRTMYHRYQNLLYDFQDKVISYLLNNYKTVYLPIFKNQEIVKKLRNPTARYNILNLSHYRFKERLKTKCNTLLHNNVVICTEEYTSKTCTRCGCLNDVGSSEMYKCNSCNLFVDRDVNGSRNIFIKNNI